MCRGPASAPGSVCTLQRKEGTGADVRQGCRRRAPLDADHDFLGKGPRPEHLGPALCRTPPVPLASAHVSSISLAWKEEEQRSCEAAGRGGRETQPGNFHSEFRWCPWAEASTVGSGPLAGDSLLNLRGSCRAEPHRLTKKSKVYLL